MATVASSTAGAGTRAGDLWGGLAAMLVALPSSIAFGVLVYSAISPDQAGAGALAGILGAATLGIVAPIIGRNGGFITAPCAPAAAILSALAAELVRHGGIAPDRIVALLVVAWRMFDRSVFRLAMLRSTRLDFAVIITVVAVAQVDLIAATATGIFLAILLFIRDQAGSTVIVTKRDLRAVRAKRRRLFAEAEILDRNGEEAIVVQLHGNLFFGTTDKLFTELEQDMSKRRFVLFDLRRVTSMDYTAAHLFEQMRTRLGDSGGELLFSSMPSGLVANHDIEDYMAQLGLVRGGKGIRVFETRDSAIEWIEDRVLEAHGWTPEEEDAALSLGEIEIFGGLDASIITELAGAVRELGVPAGGAICSQGDAGDELFLVRSGRVSALLPLETGKRHHVATFCPGDFFGEMAFIDHQPRSANVEAATPTELFLLSRARFDELVVRDPALGGIIFERLAVAISKRLRTADTELRVLEER